MIRTVLALQIIFFFTIGIIISDYHENLTEEKTIAAVYVNLPMKTLLEIRI